MDSSQADTVSQADLAAEAIERAEAWQAQANLLLTPAERAFRKKMERLVRNPGDKAVLLDLIDQSFRSANPARVADQITAILKRHGIPRFFSPLERLSMHFFMTIGARFPELSIPFVIDKIRKESSRSVIPGEPETLRPHLERRREEGVRVNLNHLGEAVLGEGEALSRLRAYVADLKRPDIEHISVKISTIYSQIQSFAFAESIKILSERLSILYRAAAENVFVRLDGTRVPKFVNLDMEEYRDLEITAEAFLITLDQDEFRNHSAGIALQAYLPDSLSFQREITDWAKRRVAAGGSPVKIRIVKGANLEMERLEAALKGWALAPYDDKRDVDANYKRMVEYGMQPENIRAVRLGIASHNLFEIGYAYSLARKRDVLPFVSFEMIEGMADHVRRAVQETTGEILLYAPVASRDQFINAVGYLVRRLDENTGPDNYLRHSFELAPGNAAWGHLKERFIVSCPQKRRPGTTPHRTQNRLTENPDEKKGTFHRGEFRNEPDTDWSLPPNRRWAEEIRDKWRRPEGISPIEVPLVFAGNEYFTGRAHREIYDPSRIDETAGKRIVARHALAGESDVDSAVAASKADPDGWRSLPLTRRHEILSRVAVEFRRSRGDLIGAAAAETGKIFTESDPEVSEAVDFLEYYPFSLAGLADLKNLEARGRGVGVVISPWNFPISIPCSGIAAALAAGNTVIFKPASPAVLVGWELCKCFWAGGVSRNTLQFLPCSGSDTGSRLTGHPDVDFIILTGGTATGLAILRGRPDACLAAETGGKNATIVTAMSDRDQAIKNVIRSAFGNSGQKCSATSLLILEEEVYRDLHFRKQLVDAAESFSTGSAWDFGSRAGPLIRPPEGELKWALTQNAPGETWALRPRNTPGNPHMWTPGIKWGVKPGSISHLTEFFGPVLGVMCARDLRHAVELVNQTGYGLTSGLESLDLREQEYWKETVQAGNLYINRSTTGAVVLRQPFGGMGKSALGPGIKVGGPDYAAQLMRFSDIAPPPAGPIRSDHPFLRLSHEWERKLDSGRLKGVAPEIEKTVRAVKNYLFRYETDFSIGKDYFHLRGEDNLFRYLPAGRVVVRIHEKDDLFEILARIAAAKIAGCNLVVSLPGAELDSRIRSFLLEGEAGPLLEGEAVVRQTDADLIRMIPEIERIRFAASGRVPKTVFDAAARTGFYISREPVLMEGRIELLRYLKEQSVCTMYHRYGNLGERESGGLGFIPRGGKRAAPPGKNANEFRSRITS